MSTKTADVVHIKSRRERPSSSEIKTLCTLDRRTFCRRHPWLAFVVAPIPMVLVFTALYVVCAVGLANLTRGATIDTHPQTLTALMILFRSTAYVPAVLAALVVSHCAWTSAVRRRWHITAGLLIALVAGCMTVSCKAPTAPGTGQFMVGLGVGSNFDLHHAIQAAVPLAFTLAFMMSNSRRPNIATAA